MDDRTTRTDQLQPGDIARAKRYLDYVEKTRQDIAKPRRIVPALFLLFVSLFTATAAVLFAVRFVRWILPVFVVLVLLTGCVEEKSVRYDEEIQWRDDLISSQREYIDQLRDFLYYETCSSCRKKWFTIEAAGLVDGDTLYLWEVK